MKLSPIVTAAFGASNGGVVEFIAPDSTCCESQERTVMVVAGDGPQRVVGGMGETPGFDYRAHLESVISHGTPPIKWVRRVLAERRPHAGIELVFTPKEEVGLIGAKEFDVGRLSARAGYVYEKVPKAEVEELVLEEVPDIDYADIGGLASQIDQIDAWIAEHGTIVGAPGLKDEHLPVFDVAVGERAISHMGHIKMMGAVQPFISGAISKTVNLPEEATVEDVSQLLIESWQLGVKAIAIYRDNCKVAQPLSKRKDAAAIAPVPVSKHERKRLPDDRTEIGRKFRVGDYEGYIHVGLYDDGTPGDIFVDIAKEGTTLAGLMNSFMISVSLGLQYGVPLEVYVSKFSHMRFEPSGMTNDADIRIAKSIVDYIFRWMGKKFLTSEQQEEAGILTAEVKARLAQAYAAGEAEAPSHEAPPKGQTALFNTWEDAVECAKCGGRMVRTGQPTGSSRTTTDFEVGVLLCRAVESSGTRGFVSG